MDRAPDRARAPLILIFVMGVLYGHPGASTILVNNAPDDIGVPVPLGLPLVANVPNTLAIVPFVKMKVLTGADFKDFFVTASKGDAYNLISEKSGIGPSYVTKSQIPKDFGHCGGKIANVDEKEGYGIGGASHAFNLLEGPDDNPGPVRRLKFVGSGSAGGRTGPASRPVRGFCWLLSTAPATRLNQFEPFAFSPVQGSAGQHGTAESISAAGRRGR